MAARFEQKHNVQANDIPSTNFTDTNTGWQSKYLTRGHNIVVFDLLD